MSTLISNVFSINGVIDTTKNVKSNIDVLAAACSSWVTFDIHSGKWSVVVNEPGSSIASFNDSNIIGSISISGSGLTELYNKVQLDFPHKDLNDQIDTITYEIPSGDRYPYEYDNILNYQFDCINDPIQAEYLAAIQLKQSRVDKVIQFRTDFSKLGLKAGDIIDVTNTMYSYSSKKFRILSISEEDNEDHTIVINITAFEYDADVYTSSGLVRTERSKSTGIVGNCLNSAISNSEQAANEVSIMKLLLPLAASSAINGLWNMMFPKVSKSLAEALNTPKVTITADHTSICEDDTVIFSIAVCCSTCNDLSGVPVEYTITGVDASDIDVPLKGTITVNSSGVGTLSVKAIDDSTVEGSETLTFTAGGSSTTVTLIDRRTYSMAASSSITEGSNTSVTITTTGIPNGTSIPYSITGSGVGQLSGTNANGSVTVNSNSATLPIATKNISSTVDTSLLVVFDPGTYYCSGTNVTITLTHTGTPVVVVPDTLCEWVTIPLDWCASFDGSTNQPKTVFGVGTITVLKAISGQPKETVPISATVSTSGVITIADTVDIDMSTGKGGFQAKVIKTFNNMTAGVKKVTGTTIDVLGH